MKPFSYSHRSYKPPGRDSARAMANVRLFLNNAREIDHLLVTQLCDRYNLTLRTAEAELTAAKKRRAER